MFALSNVPQSGCDHHRCRLVRCRLEANAAHDLIKIRHRGIGLESAILFASEGANIVLADINQAAAENAQKLIGSKSPNVKTVVVKSDVGKEEDVKALVDRAVAEFGRLDVMVRFRPSHHFLHLTHIQFNNAGIYVVERPMPDPILTGL